LGENAWSDEIQVGYVAGGNRPRLREYLAKEEQPECRLDCPPEQFRKAVVELAYIDLSDYERLLQNPDMGWNKVVMLAGRS